MNIEVTITKTRFFVLALFLLVVGVVAYNSNPANPAVFGHSANEIEITLVNGTNVSVQSLLSEGADSGIPSGMIALFDTTCPSGWSRYSNLDGKVPRGSTTYGTTGGSDTILLPYNTNGGEGGQQIPTAQIIDNWPPYLTMIWCKKN